MFSKTRSCYGKSPCRKVRVCANSPLPPGEDHLPATWPWRRSPFEYCDPGVWMAWPLGAQHPVNKPSAGTISSFCSPSDWTAHSGGPSSERTGKTLPPPCQKMTTAIPRAITACLAMQDMFHLAYNNCILSFNPQSVKCRHFLWEWKDLGLTTLSFKNS